MSFWLTTGSSTKITSSSTMGSGLITGWGSTDWLELAEISDSSGLIGCSNEGGGSDMFVSSLNKLDWEKKYTANNPRIINKTIIIWFSFI